ncbi:hypothetical protein [Flavobacterium sp. CAN_S2]|uniref:hypothetical protein n=1 Tax=Flavobacterium sp. CAN_S2 TaxID=2787726 RepID=UPI0018CA13FA
MEKRVKKNSDYWYDIIMGAILTFIIIYFIGNIILTKLELEFLKIYYLLFCIIVVIYYQWKDDNFEALDTKLTAEENFELTLKTLKKLNWEYEKDSGEIKLTCNKYLLKFLNVIIIPKKEKIYFNFKYHSTLKTGRLPFFFGISTFLKWKFKDRLITE